MYPGYNFGQQQPSFGQNPIVGQLPFGSGQPGQMSPLGQPGMGQMPTMGGPTLGQGFMQQSQQQQPQQQQDQQQRHGGFLGQFGPMFGLAGMMAGGGGGGMLYPMLGGLAGWGLHKLKVF